MQPETVEKLTGLAERAGAKLGRALMLLACDAVTIVQQDAQPAPTAAADDDEGITVEEAARELGVNTWRVYEMIRRGLLPAYRPSPKTIRLRRGDVREFIRAGKCAPDGQSDTANIVKLKRRPVLHSVPRISTKEAQQA